MKKNLMNEQENSAALSGAGKETESRRERPVGVRLRFGIWNLWGAGLLLLSAALTFILFPGLFHSAETGELAFGSFFWAYWGLTALTAALCFTELRLPEAVRQAASWLAVFIMPIGAFYAVDLINDTRILTFSGMRCLANYICYLVVFAFFYAVSRRAWVTALCGGTAFLLFGIVNYFVVQFRGQPILPWDISAAATAAEVSRGYKYTPTGAMVLSVLGLVCTVIVCLRLAPREKASSRKKRRFIERLCALGLFGLLAVLLFPADILTDMGISVWAWNQKTSSEITGVMAGFYANVQFLMVDKPDHYSQESVAQLEEQLEAMEEPAPLGYPGDQLPTIIVVMNESMTDLQAVGDLEFTPDNQPFLHTLQKAGDVIWGTAYSSVYGGNTCNSEYEFLTGNTMAFLPSGSKPYQQYVRQEQTALPSILKSYGYSCTAIHPGNRTAWQRDTAYPYLGFDEFISAKTFDIQRELKRGLTTDLSGYEQVIYEYEHRDGAQPQFLFHVTIQNHGGYEDDDYPTTVQIKGMEGMFPQTEQYLSLVRESNEALEALLNYFAGQRDPVVILFFGDHWPNLETGFLSQLLEANAKDLEFEDMMREYQVPFFIWANYPLQGQHVEKISVNYLSGLLLRAAGLEGTEYTKFLEALRQEVPVITAVGVMGAQGDLYKNGEETPYDELLTQYAVLQYNNAFDEDEKAETVFSRQ